MSAKQSFRPDIQALRALAVGLVLVFHVWPAALPGGYIGVDVFFVISGYLITGSLYRELDDAGRLRFVRFYLRRFRRLMPAASVVILATVTLSWLLEPAFRAGGTALEGLASGLYWQNWLLAWQATDYLAAESPLGPLTHYWSLSIEEQFYLVWPALLTACYVLAIRRGNDPRTTVRNAILLLSAASLGASAIMAGLELPEAYFVTHTRVWELGLGAALALTPLPHPTTGTGPRLVILAHLIIILCAITMPADIQFPGLIALIPTLAAAGAIHAGQTAPCPPGLGTRPVQAIGDASYSIYLWHWPLVYFAVELANTPPGLLSGACLLAASLAAGGLSKRYIEDVFRQKPVSRSRPAETAALGGACTAFLASLSAAGLVLAGANATINNWIRQGPGEGYPGAMALPPHNLTATASPHQPPLAALKSDLPVIYENGCHVHPREDEPRVCRHDRLEDDRPLVVLVGDSHAANWLPALRIAAEDAGWRLISITKSACAPSLMVPGTGVYVTQSCHDWTVATLTVLSKLKPELIVLARSRRGSDYVEGDDTRWTAGLQSMLTGILGKLARTSGQVVVLKDTPRLPEDPADCLGRSDDCTVDLDRTRNKPDVLLQAARETDSAEIVDMLDLICPDDTCSAVIGNVAVWRDEHHLTATYSRTLAPELQRRILSVID